LAIYAPRSAGTPKGCNPSGINADFGAPKLLAFRLGVPKPRFHPLDHQTALQLSNGTKNSKDHLAGRSAGIELFGEGNRDSLFTSWLSVSFDSRRLAVPSCGCGVA
jgi:hypothetical protein